jgi:CBS domain containing-hemolysin-like protein
MALLVSGFIILLLVALNGLFVVAEFALISVRPSQMEYLANQGHPAAGRFLSILRSNDRQNHYIATAQLGITLASLGLGMYGEAQISGWVEPYLAQLFSLELHATLVTTLGYLFALSLLTYLHVVVGEMAPKSVALTSPVKAAFAVLPVMSLAQTIFDLPVRLLNGIGNALLRLLRIPPAEGQARLHSPEELEFLVSESVEGGLLDANEEEIIHNIFDFSDRQVGQVMTPRPRVQAIALNTPWPQLLARMAASKRSRLPVYEGDIDHIVGILHVKDLVRYQAHQKGVFDLRLLLRPVPAVPESYPVAKLLTTFKRRRIHFAVVLDEYGGTAGIVTLEDLVEEVMGEVRDEFDQETEPFIKIAPGVLEVTGSYLLEDIAEHVDLGQPADLPDVETVGGLIMAQLGRLPYVGDSMVYREIRFTVLTVTGLAVARARVEYPAQVTFKL